MLPNMEGWGFLGSIKEVPSLRNVPVLIISITADRNKGFALGAAAGHAEADLAAGTSTTRSLAWASFPWLKGTR